MTRFVYSAFVSLVVSVAAFVSPSQGAEPQIDADFPGGNVVVDSISDDGLVKVRPDLRDTVGDWFYTAFRVKGAQGRTLTFEFDAPNRVGARGPAISSDGGETWRWFSETPDADSQRFVYTFGADEDEVFFALAPLYARADWEKFLTKYQNREGFTPGVLCQARDGSDVPDLVIRQSESAPKYGIALTARHHACETIANFVVEGLIDEIESDSDAGKFLRESCEFFVVPFVDAPGVEAGDQGKNRAPHDHYLDYIQEIYPSVRELKKYIVDNFQDKQVVFMDWHCPWIRGDYNENIYSPETDVETASRALREYSQLLEEEQQGKALRYRATNNLPVGQGWNISSTDEQPQILSSKHWAEKLPNILFYSGYEIPYANAGGGEITPDAARELGRSAAKALARLLKEKSQGAKPQIDADFPGGNIIVDSISEDGLVKLRPDLRDTVGDWFYTAFRVRGAQGRTLTFEFDKPNRVGARGPAISSDGGETWRWLSETPDADSQRFVYAFADDEDEVVFALAPLYTRANWEKFLTKYQDRQGFTPGVLCQARDGSDVPVLKIAQSSAAPQYGVAFTARHHCCEMIASFVVEGLIDEIESDSEAGTFLRENCEFFVVPFVDAPGVEAGDQGKNRAPHDHNRDYIQEIYPSVRELKKYIVDNFQDKQVVFMDWHCPWIRGGKYNENVYSPETDVLSNTLVLHEYSQLLEEEQQGKALPYLASNNLPFGQDWNKTSNYERKEGEPPTLSSKHWAERLPNLLLACGYEIPYANAGGAAITPDAAREFGRSAAKALARLIQAKAEPKIKRSFGGIYPHLGYFNDENECGTGAVVPWADRLWFVTYGPHLPNGSSDKLYELDSDLNLAIRPESVGGTNANRMIHRESNQLFIGNHAIDADGNVRTIPHQQMYGRETAVARHLFDPKNKVYFLTMEEGLYEVDVNTLDVREIYKDGNKQRAPEEDVLPGYHGKGGYTSQGRVVYANNGEASEEAKRDPTIPSGSLSEWFGEDEGWNVVKRNQFTEVTGPDGIYGGTSEQDDVLWSMGWDFRSVMLMVLQDGEWSLFRLPKASHCYDGAHGWNTEWPRIRKINDDKDYLATMHGQFWSFPASFRADAAVGIRPRSTYLKVIGDWAYWNDKSVFGCDDSARSEFLNKSPFKPNLAGPGQSNSNLWFVEPDQLDAFGPALGRGAVWLHDDVDANAASDPYLFAGYDRRSAFYSFASADDADVKLTFEVDRDGTGNWVELKTVDASARKYGWIDFDPKTEGEWIRVTSNAKLADAVCFFSYQNDDKRPLGAADKFAGLAAPDDAQNFLGARLWTRADNKRLAVVSKIVADGKVQEERYYELTEYAELKRVPCRFEGGEQGTIERVNAMVEPKEIDPNVCQIDDLSVLLRYGGKSWRLPIGSEAAARVDSPVALRLDREICTERDLFHCAGTFYELPAENAGGLPKIRPIATDGALITDYASYRGMLVLAGVTSDPDGDSERIVRADDAGCALWLGSADDLWSFGKPRGHGCVWKDSDVKAGDVSDPMLATGFSERRVVVLNNGDRPVTIALEFDPTGDGTWVEYPQGVKTVDKRFELNIPDGEAAYWIRAVAKDDGNVSVFFVYGEE